MTHDKATLKNLLTATLVSLAATSGLAGCDAPTVPEADAESRWYISGGSCSAWRCGYNAAEINGKSLQELHVNGQANADGVKIVGFLSPLSLIGYKLRVEGDKFVARGGLLLGELEGPALIGSTILVKVESGLVVPVIINDVGTVDSWADGAAPVTAYSLIYADLDDPLQTQNVCQGSLVDPLQAVVTLIGGETYDDETKTVNANQGGWFTMACAGSAAAKMKLMNYGPNSDFEDGEPATVAQRQATLKMITADYCGGGESYTANGTPVLWENQSGTVVPDSDTPQGAIEAIWDEDGAVCLDTPRLVDPSEIGCAIPSCDEFSLDDGQWQTINVGE